MSDRSFTDPFTKDPDAFHFEIQKQLKIQLRQFLNNCLIYTCTKQEQMYAS